MLKVKIGLRGLNPTDKLQKAERVVSGLSSSSIFNKNKKLIKELSSAQVALSKAIEMAEYGDRRAIALRNLCVRNIDAKIRQAASYVEAFSNGNEEEILKSGFEIRRRNNRTQPLSRPENFSIRRTENEGELRLSWSPVKNSKNYLIQTCTSKSEKSRKWLTILYTTKSRCLVDNLKLGTTYHFRVLAIGAGGIGPPSNTEAIMAA
jgi:hypothetical protein